MCFDARQVPAGAQHPPPRKPVEAGGGRDSFGIASHMHRLADVRAFVSCG